MFLKEYSQRAPLTLLASLRDDEIEKIESLFGFLFEEAAEVIREIMRPISRKDYQFNIESIKLELGDLLWNITMVSQAIGSDLEDIAIANLKKVYSIEKKTNIRLEGPLDFDVYQKYAEETIRPEIVNNQINRLRSSWTGICKEVGEIEKEFGEYSAYGNVLNIDKIKERLGDTLWFISLICNTLNINLEEIAAINIEKREKRYNIKGELRKEVNGEDLSR